MRALLVAGDPLFAKGLRHLLEAGGHAVVGTASDGVEAVVKARVLRPDVVLLDAHLPGLCLAEVARRIRTALPGEMLIVLVDPADAACLCDPFRGTVSACLPKYEAGTRLLDLLASLAGATWSCSCRQCLPRRRTSD
jgi:DNA-binding NarL/FixJ family response regulator